MRATLDQQSKAVASRHWPLIRYDPLVRAANGTPLLLDLPRPRIQLGGFRKGELRFRALADTDSAEAERVQDLAQRTVRQGWQICEGTAGDFAANARKDP